MFANTSYYKFIVIEGIDGVGKTTTARLLSNLLPAQYYKLPPSLLEQCEIVDQEYGERSLRKYIDQLAFTMPHARFLFYLLGLVQATKEIQGMLSKGHVVADRYMASTLAHHWALDSNLREVNLSWLSIIKPDFQFLLTIRDHEEHKRRLSERGLIRSDYILESNKDYLFRVQDYFRELGLTEIDTTYRPVEKTTREILEQIQYDLV